jgi:hypothetical protein
VTAGLIIPAMPGTAPDSEQLRTLRGALALLAEDPPLELGSCALARRLLPTEADPLRRGQALGHALRTAIGYLHPCTHLPTGDRRWWPYRICVFEFVEGRSRGEIAELLAISASTYTRAKRRALERIAEALPHLVRMQNSE